MEYTDQGEEYASSGFMYGGETAEKENFTDQLKEFVKAAVEMSVEFGRGIRDIAQQNLQSENSFISRNFGNGSYIGRRLKGPCAAIFSKLGFFVEFLPEDKNPLHVWSVILLVLLVSFAALFVSTHESYAAPPTLMKKAYIHPADANRTLLPDGRFMAYRQQGVSADEARFSIITPHSFLSSRLSGIPGLKTSLLDEFGVRLITYDLPGFGESDPHPGRTLESSAIDMLFLADALGVKDKFWVVGYSTGSIHAWSALRYIPDKLAGAAMFAPMVNPYDSTMTRDEKRRTWRKWTSKRKFMYFLSHRFPMLLSFFYHRSFLSGKHDQIDNWLSLSLGSRDKALIEDPIYQEFWQRDVEESIRQRNAKPFVEEAVLQVSNWGFSLKDIKLQKKKRSKGLISLLKHVLSGHEQELTGFLGPIHIWQGMDDTVVPPAMTDFVHRVLPGAAVHKLPYEGHFSYFCFCDECHRQILTTLFGTPRGPLTKTTGTDEDDDDDGSSDEKTEVQEQSRTPDSTEL